LTETELKKTMRNKTMLELFPEKLLIRNLLKLVSKELVFSKMVIYHVQYSDNKCIHTF